MSPFISMLNVGTKKSCSAHLNFLWSQVHDIPLQLLSSQHEWMNPEASRTLSSSITAWQIHSQGEWAVSSWLALPLFKTTAGKHSSMFTYTQCITNDTQDNIEVMRPNNVRLSQHFSFVYFKCWGKRDGENILFSYCSNHEMRHERSH